MKLKSNYLDSMSLAALCGLLVMVLQAVSPASIEFQFNPFGGWQPDDWIVERSTFDLSPRYFEASPLILQAVSLRFFMLFVNFGLVYLCVPVGLAFLLCKLEEGGKQTVLWALLDSLFFTTSLFFYVGSILLLVTTVLELPSLTGPAILLCIFVAWCHSFAELIRLCFPWIALCLWLVVYTCTMYHAHWQADKAAKLWSKLVVSRVLIVGALWLHHGAITGYPQVFPFNHPSGGKPPHSNLVDRVRRLGEIVMFGDVPIWYSEIHFPPYPGSKVAWTSRKTFGRWKGWCSASIESGNSCDKVTNFYKNWVTANNYKVYRDETGDDGGTLFRARKPGTSIWFQCHPFRDGETIAFIEQVPHKSFFRALP